MTLAYLIYLLSGRFAVETTRSLFVGVNLHIAETLCSLLLLSEIVGGMGGGSAYNFSIILDLKDLM